MEPDSIEMTEVNVVLLLREWNRLSIANFSRGSLFIIFYSLASSLESTLEMAQSMAKLKDCNKVHMNKSPLGGC